MSEPAHTIATSNSPKQTKAIAAALASCAKPDDAIILIGSLGAGKTQFSQGFAEGLGIDDAIISPTFNILLSYEGNSQRSGLSLNHFDLYRLDDASQLEDIGFYDVIESGGVSLIEWGDRFPGIIDDCLQVEISIEDDDHRTIGATAYGSRAHDMMAAWQSALEAASASASETCENIPSAENPRSSERNR